MLHTCTLRNSFIHNPGFKCILRSNNAHNCMHVQLVDNWFKQVVRKMSLNCTFAFTSWFFSKSRWRPHEYKYRTCLLCLHHETLDPAEQRRRVSGAPPTISHRLSIQSTAPGKLTGNKGGQLEGNLLVFYLSILERG